MLAQERQADQPVTRLRASDELGIADVAFSLRAEEDALAGPHRLRERVVAGDREAAERIDVPVVVAARCDHLEPLPVVAQGGDQSAAGLSCAHALDEHRVEHLLWRPRRGECVGDELQSTGGLKSLEARRRLPLGAGAGADLAREHLSAQ